MIDIHHHLIFGVDDGPKDIESSIALAEAAIRDGITHVVCTPHANLEYDFNPAINQERMAAIQERVGGKLKLGIGCDLHLSTELVQMALDEPTRFSINKGRYVLVEFADFMIPRDINHTFYEFTFKGMVPIITHPERNPLLQENVNQMIEWMQLGCLIQITAASLEGRFGRRAEARAWELLEKNWVHFVASDAHSVNGRPPALSAAHAAIARKLGEPTARRLCIDNPLAAFENKPLPAQPAAIGVYEEEEEPVRKRRGFLSRLMGKR